MNADRLAESLRQEVSKAKQPKKIRDRAVALAQMHGFDLAHDFTLNQKKVGRDVLALAVERGWSDAYLKRRLAMVAGLDTKGAAALQRYHDGLLAGGIPLGRADRLADAYAKRLKNTRANRLAGHEVRNVVNQAKRELWSEQQANGELSRWAVRVTRVHKDERLCKVCLRENGRRRSLARDLDVGPPFHIGCRCTEELMDEGIVKTDPSLWGPVVKGYNPDAKDGDGDGKAQDGTKWIHPVRPGVSRRVGKPAGGYQDRLSESQATIINTLLDQVGVDSGFDARDASGMVGKAVLRTTSYRNRKDLKERINKRLSDRVYQRYSSSPDSEEARLRLRDSFNRVFTENEFEHWVAIKTGVQFGSDDHKLKVQEMQAKIRGDDGEGTALFREFVKYYASTSYTKTFLFLEFDPETATYSQLRDQYVERGLHSQSDEFIRTVINAWASTSMDNSSNSVALQYASFLKMGGTDEGFRQKLNLSEDPEVKMQRAVNTYKETPSLYDGIIEAMREDAQAMFAKAGIKEVMVYRGISVDTDLTPYTQQSYEVDPWPLSSWSFDPETAMGFTEGDGQWAILSMKVPVESIYSSCFTGYGCLSETEVVVGAVDTIYAYLMDAGSIDNEDAF